MRIAFASTPVGAIGAGQGGGVETTIQSLANGLARLGHSVEIYAPFGSHASNAIVHQVEGTLQASTQKVSRTEPIAMTKGSVLVGMWDLIQQQQDRFDVIINFAYDWLPMQLTSLMRTPTVHLVSMASLTDAMDKIIISTSHQNKFAVAMHSATQSSTFVGVSTNVQILGNGIDLGNYVFNPNTNGPLGFVGRISPEKGISDVVAVAARTGLPLQMWGLMQDDKCFNDALAKNPLADVQYNGFLKTSELGQVIGECRGLLVASKWVEAFGSVVIEAMACGVPVIAYRRGGPSEIIQDGLNGFLVEPDNINSLVSAVARLETISRVKCREHVVKYHSVSAFAQRVEGWLVARCATSV